MKGYIKDFRKELNSDIWMMPPLYHRVWQYLKYKVNHKENRIPVDDFFLTIKPGQHLTSVRIIAKGVGYYEQLKWKEPNPKTVSKVLEWLEKQGMISIERGKGNRQYTLVNLIQWEDYQIKEDEGNSKGTPHGEGREHPVDINKNDKECIKNEKEEEEDENPFELFESNICILNPINRDSLASWCEDLGDDLVIAAIKTAAKYNARSFKYFEDILREWTQQNIKTTEQARNYLKEKSKRGSNVTQFPKRKTASDIKWDEL